MAENKETGFVDRGWLKLDNAAKIYPPVMNREISSVFRIGCLLTHPVRISALQKAIDQSCPRFPYYLTTLRKGFFWFFLEYNRDIRPELLPEGLHPCVAFPAKRGQIALFRIIVHGNSLSVEFLHVLSDGGGALEFFRTLLVTYLRICKYNISYAEGIIDPHSQVDPEEAEDSYNRYFSKDIPMPSKLENAWHLPYVNSLANSFNLTYARIETGELKMAAAVYHVSLTEYLAAVYLFSLMNIRNSQQKKRSPLIRVEVPVNLRNHFQSKTMRNFSLFVMPEIDLRLGDYSFEEITKLVHNYMQVETDKKVISKIIARNVKPERNPIIRVVPLFVKNIFLSRAFKKFGASKYSGVLTNLGIVKMPEEAKEHISSFYIIPPPPTKELKVSCGVITYSDKLILTFSNNTGNPELERVFCRFLVSEKIKVKIINPNFPDAKEYLP